MFALLPMPAPVPRIERPRAQAIATVQILNSASASEKAWTLAPAHRREIRVRERDGRITLVRLIEHE